VNAGSPIDCDQLSGLPTQCRCRCHGYAGSSCTTPRRGKCRSQSTSPPAATTPATAAPTATAPELPDRDLAAPNAVSVAVSDGAEPTVIDLLAAPNAESVVAVSAGIEPRVTGLVPGWVAPAVADGVGSPVASAVPSGAELAVSEGAGLAVVGLRSGRRRVGMTAVRRRAAAEMRRRYGRSTGCGPTSTRTSNPSARTRSTAAANRTGRRTFCHQYVASSS